MRHARLLLLAVSSLSASAFFSSCTSSGPAGVYAFIQWRVRCEEMGMCTPRPDRCVDGFDNEVPSDTACTRARISCNVLESDDSRTLSFSVQANDFGLQVQSAVFTRGASVPSGSACIARVDDDNTYIGSCGGTAPSEAQPCQISNVSFARDDEGRARIRGQMLCRGISPNAAPDLQREVTAAGNTAEARMSPLTFDLYDCAGFQPD